MRRLGCAVSVLDELSFVGLKKVWQKETTKNSVFLFFLMVKYLKTGQLDHNVIVSPVSK